MTTSTLPTILQLAHNHQTGFFLIFGGQGTTYLTELSRVYSSSTPSSLVRRLIHAASDALSEQTASQAAIDAHAQLGGFDLLNWISNEPKIPETSMDHPLSTSSSSHGSSRALLHDGSLASSDHASIPPTAPSTKRLHDATLSYPLILLTQLAHYAWMLETYGMSQSQLLAGVRGASGHSQGVVAAIVVASSINESKLIDNTIKAIKYLFWQGVRSHQILNFSLALNDDGTTNESPMLAVTGLPPPALSRIIENLKLNTQTFVSLINGLQPGSSRCVVSGYPKSLSSLNKALKMLSANMSDDQGRIPYTKRKPLIVTQFLCVTAPFHCCLGQDAAIAIKNDMLRLNIEFLSSELQVPVYATDDGRDLKSIFNTNIINDLIDMQAIHIAKFNESLKPCIGPSVTHVLDFGPGGRDLIGSVAKMTTNITAGLGVKVVVVRGGNVDPLELKISKDRGSGAMSLSSIIFSSIQPTSIQYASNWGHDFSPKLVKRMIDNIEIVETKFTRLVGKPPIMIGGMTPTTSLNGVDLVAAAANGGFHVELAGGGLPRPNIFKNKINELVSKLTPGIGIIINILYLNARQWGFQYPLALDLAKQGYPIESITIAAGVPTPEKADEIIINMQQAGLKYVSLKPGSIDHIRQCLNIARRHPTYPIIIQWTGGRGGGHHSCEDFHQPLLETYNEIRGVSNVTLVVGSGFGDAEDSFPYLTGEWSLKFKTAPMPVDCILLGSRCMVAKEAATSIEVKRLIVACSGVKKESDWEMSYDGVAGGVITVQSELGEAIHKVLNRGTQVWREFDKKYFSLPRGIERKKKILLDKKLIINRLNADFQKVFFGETKDLEEMTYAMVLSRMIELMFVSSTPTASGANSSGYWVDMTYYMRVFAMAERTERRFCRQLNAPMQVEDRIFRELLKQNPRVALTNFLLNVPAAERILLSEEDVHFFIDLCREGGKPVPFIPVIDENLDYWFKKDSLWYSEQLDAVRGRDAGRVIILHGPVSAQYSTVVDESICQILGNIHNGYVERLVHKLPSQQESSSVIPLVDFVGGPVLDADAATKCLQQMSTTWMISEAVPNVVNDISHETRHSIQFPQDGFTLPPRQDFMNVICQRGNSCGWLMGSLLCHRLVFSSTVGSRWDTNPLPKVFKPRSGHRYDLIFYENSPNPMSLQVYDSNGLLVTSIEFNSKLNEITLMIMDYRPPELDGGIVDPVPLKVVFQYLATQGYSLLHQNTQCVERVIKQYYSEMWLDSKSTPSLPPPTTPTPVYEIYTDSVTLTKEMIESFNAAIGNEVDPFDMTHSTPEAEVDISIVVAWKPLVASLFSDKIEGNLLRLVHLSHAYRILDPSAPLLNVGDVVTSSLRLRSISTTASGRRIEVHGHLSRPKISTTAPWLEITSVFLIRGAFDDSDGVAFSLRENYKMTISIPTSADLAVFLAKPWLEVMNQNINTKSKSLQRFDIVLEKVLEKYGNKGLLSHTTVIGRVSIADEVTTIGHIEYIGDGSLRKNPVLDYLEQFAVSSEPMSKTDDGYIMLSEPIVKMAPLESITYARSSRDLNPIHRSSYMAELADLPGGSTIVHGMWTAALARGIVKSHTTKDSNAIITSFKVKFTGMVFPGEELVTQLRHVGVVGGRTIINVEMNNRHGERVLVATAETEQPKIAYLFTGQGSAAVGMGMDRYKENNAVREVWDCAERHLKSSYGFSILDIVRNNPKEITIHFGGPVGKAIRRNYQKITIQGPSKDQRIPLIAEIRDDTKSFTFYSPEGLLFATQFAQPALVLVQNAAFRELKDYGYMPPQSVFAGHSLGEYAALASFAEVLTIEALAETVFLRGLVMQKSCPRDNKGRSEYGMVAANPSRVGTGFTPQSLIDLVNQIAETSGRLLQVVNFNVIDQQYVVAGELRNLEALSTTLSAICRHMTERKPLMSSSAITDLIQDCLTMATKRKASCVSKDEIFSLERGIATIPLAGIDVPFHSHALLDGVPSFRELLQVSFDLERVAHALPRLIDRYIPNLNAQLFSLSKSYVESLIKLTNSQKLKGLLANYDNTSDVVKAQTLLIELLAYQFAMPVQWIETQDLILKGGCRRIIEMGPAATLTGMMMRTLSSGRYGDDPREILWWQRDRDMILYKYDNFGPSVDDYQKHRRQSMSIAESSQEDALRAGGNHGGGSDTSSTSTLTVAVASDGNGTALHTTPATPTNHAHSNNSTNATMNSNNSNDSHNPNYSSATSDLPVDAKHAMKVLLSTKFNKSISTINDDDSIKVLSGGKSALQNEVVGEFTDEFSGIPDEAAELSIQQLADKVSSNYTSIGKVLTKNILKMISSKFCGGFTITSARSYLSSSRSLGPGRVDSILLHGLTMQSVNRMNDDVAVKQWLDLVTDAYGSYIGVSFPKSSSALSAVTGVAMMDSATTLKHFSKLRQLIHDQSNACLEFLDIDPLTDQRRILTEQSLRSNAEMSLQMLRSELGTVFCDGILPMHSPLKVRTFDSYWNWVHQTALEMHYHLLARVRLALGEPITHIPYKTNPFYCELGSWVCSLLYPTANESNKGVPAAMFRNRFLNRATQELFETTAFFAKSMEKRGYPEYGQAIALMAEEVGAWVKNSPVFVCSLEPTRPYVTITDMGVIKYEELPRDGVRDAIGYVEEMSRGVGYSLDLTVGHRAPSQGVTLPLGWQSFVPNEDVWIESDSDNETHKITGGMNDANERIIDPVTATLPAGEKLNAMRENVRRRRQSSDFHRVKITKEVPYIHIRTVSDVDPTIRLYDEARTQMYLSCMHETSTKGVSFSGQVALVTGASLNSIALEVVKSLLQGGATVIVTTWRTDKRLQEHYSQLLSLYMENGSKYSKLICEPCNCASVSDIDALVSHIYTDLDLDIDFLLPFAALGEGGRDIDNIDSHSELAHRMMLTNAIRLLGAVKKAKQRSGIETRPAMTILPCSPNHGVFGGDGLYAESKLGCESLLNKWSSEGWQNYLSITAAVIGWTRSALMSQNNNVAPGVESLGMRTFSTEEMGYNLVGLLHPLMVTAAAEAPLWADLTGNWVSIPDINSATSKLREDLAAKAALAKAVAAQPRYQISPDDDDSIVKTTVLADPSKMYSKFPTLPISQQELFHETGGLQLQSMVDLRKVVVVVGFGEIGPWGNSRTRWEMEAYGEFSIEGCIELAWLVGLIKPHQGPLKNSNTSYVGWIDATTGEPVSDAHVKARYEETLLNRCGIRIVEPALFDGYDPKKKSMLHQVAIDRPMYPVQVDSQAEAYEFANELGMDNVDIFERAGQWYIRLKQGSVIYVPRALQFSRFVAGQIPTGWDAQRLGVPADLATSVDPVTLYALVSTVDALISAGITDPYEFYKYVHVTEVGNTSGGGMGGMRSLTRIFYERKLEKTIAADSLAESFINTISAWINMLLLSSSGPILTPVGACATAAESVDIGCETIQCGKARVVIVGGYDDFGETGSYEFAQMGATADSQKEAELGRDPREASRPTSSSRAGFVEAHGAGIQILMDAELAIEMGVPIYAIIAETNTATDREGRSIPAPGQGILTTARETKRLTPSPLLALSYRREMLMNELLEIDAWRDRQRGLIVKTIATTTSLSQGSAGNGGAMSSGVGVTMEGIQEACASQLEAIEHSTSKRRQGAYDTWGQGFYRGCHLIAPIRGALAVYGLTIDDLSMATFHGTSTKLNDKNESEVVNEQLSHLGRSPGNLLPVVCQKYLTGHPKGAAAAWMLNGAVQALHSNIIPGNRNLDNCSQELRANKFLFYPNGPIETDCLKSVLLKSFGFGQAGAEILVIHPRYLLATLDNETLQSYRGRCILREQRAYRYQQRVWSGQHGLVQVKTSAPYVDDQQSRVYLDPEVRASYDSSTNTWAFGNANSSGNTTTTAATTTTTTTNNNNNVNFAISSSSEGSSSSSMSKLNASSIDATMPSRSMRRVESVGSQLERAMFGTVTQLREFSDKGIGMDVEPISTFADQSEDRTTFFERNFTTAERAYCLASPDPAAAYAGRWAAKEAAIKAMSNAAPDTPSLWRGAGAPLRDIEVVMSSSGAPTIEFHGKALDVMRMLKLSEVRVSISRAGDFALAQAVAL